MKWDIHASFENYKESVTMIWIRWTSWVFNILEEVGEWEKVTI